jgi:CheY-like chemotaxis protein
MCAPIDTFRVYFILASVGGLCTARLVAMAEQPIILYVEDDPNDAVVFERALKKSALPLGLHVAPDGQFAVDYLVGEEDYADREKFPLPKIILTDLKMFRMGGLELLQWVRSHVHFRELPVVLYSTSIEDADVSRAKAHGATAYFRKTYQCTEVLDFLRQWMEKAQCASEGHTKTKRRPATSA